jgi:hypothetical protein
LLAEFDWLLAIGEDDDAALASCSSINVEDESRPANRSFSSDACKPLLCLELSTCLLVSLDNVALVEWSGSETAAEVELVCPDVAELAGG